MSLSVLYTSAATGTAFYNHKGLLEKCLFRNYSTAQSINNGGSYFIKGKEVSSFEDKNIYDRLARAERISALNSSRGDDNSDEEISELAKDLPFCEKILNSIDSSFYSHATDLNGKLTMVVNQIAMHLESSPIIINFVNRVLLDFSGDELINHYHPSLVNRFQATHTEKLNEVELKLMPDVAQLEQHEDVSIKKRHLRFKYKPTTDNRPFYGSLYFHRNRFGSAPYDYGQSFIVLNDCIKPNCTFTVEDSFSCYKSYTMFEMKSLSLDALNEREVSKHLIRSVFLEKEAEEPIDSYLEVQIYSRVIVPEMVKEPHLNMQRYSESLKPDPKLLEISKKLKSLVDEKMLPFDLYIDGKKYVASSEQSWRLVSFLKRLYNKNSSGLPSAAAELGVRCFLSVQNV